MATRVTLTPPSADQPAHVTKTQLVNDRGDREAEAAWLERAARPGVVRVVATTEDPFTIVTENAGSRTLRTAGLSPTDGLDTTIELCGLLVELHRDGIVHGKLSPDHVIIGRERIWLCSPDGRAEDPTSDLEGLARCMAELAHQWAESDRTPDFIDDWNETATRLTDHADPGRSATRARAALRRCRMPIAAEAADDGTAALGRGPARVVGFLTGRPGLALAALAAITATGGLALVTDGAPAATGDGPQVEIDGATYRVGSSSSDVAVLAPACDASAPVVVLDTATDTIWAFDTIADGATARAVAVVPGATDVRSEWVASDGCAVAVASGPAGASVIRTTDG